MLQKELVKEFREFSHCFKGTVFENPELGECFLSQIRGSKVRGCLSSQDQIDEKQ